MTTTASAQNPETASIEREPYSLRAFLLYFLRLGALGFGGPIALAGYMQRDLVETRGWIDKKDYQWVKVELESLDTITFGGFLIRLAKGSHLTVENARVNNEVWLPKRAVINGVVRVALVKVIRGEIVFSFSDYKKFQAESRIVALPAQ